MAYAYANLLSPQNTGSGIADFVLLAPAADFAPDGIKCPAAPFTNPGDEVTVFAAHEFLPGKGFVKYALAPEKNSYDAKTIGDKGFNKFDMESTIFIPGSYAEVHEAIKNWMNQPLIALEKDSNCGANFYYQLGCDCTFAYMSPEFTTGTTKDGVKGYSVKLTWQNDYVQIHKPVAVPQTLGTVPAAPTAGVVDDVANTFDWTNAAGFTAVSDYETTTDGGTTYTTAVAKPLAGITGAEAIGQVGVRVKAVGANPASATLFNATAYTA